MKLDKKKQEEHDDLVSKLDKRFSSSMRKKNFIYWRKKFSWWFIIGGAKFIKRLLDIVIALSLLTLTGPLLLLIALIIKISDGGPIFYISTRVGQWGKEFSFPKFRTMSDQADLQKEELRKMGDFPGSIRFKMKEDPRVTAVGKFLRKYTLDEFPQLWCVLKGDMSLVGPRPPLPEEVAQYTLEERGRLDVPPGLTCIWQVAGRSSIPFDRQVQMDREYIESQSFLLDLQLLLKTIPAIFFGRGAY